MTGLTVAQVLSQTFNGRVEWAVPGAYIKILSAAANLQLEAFKGGVLVLLAPTVKAGFYQRCDFDRIVVTNTGAQLTEILVAPDQGGSDAFTANSVITSPLVNEGGGSGVLVSQFGDAISSAAASFLGGATTAAVAANTSFVQLFNPLASGVVLYVDQVTISNATAAGSSATLRDHNVALGALAYQGRNKSLSAAAALGAIRGGVEGATAGTELGQITLGLNAPITVRFATPVRVPAGRGLHVETAVANQTLTASYEWREKAT